MIDLIAAKDQINAIAAAFTELENPTSEDLVSARVQIVALVSDLGVSRSSLDFATNEVAKAFAESGLGADTGALMARIVLDEMALDDPQQDMKSSILEAASTDMSSLKYKDTSNFMNLEFVEYSSGPSVSLDCEDVSEDEIGDCLAFQFTTSILLPQSYVLALMSYMEDLLREIPLGFTELEILSLTMGIEQGIIDSIPEEGMSLEAVCGYWGLIESDLVSIGMDGEHLAYIKSYFVNGVINIWAVYINAIAAATIDGSSLEMFLDSIDVDLAAMKLPDESLTFAREALSEAFTSEDLSSLAYSGENFLYAAPQFLHAIRQSIPSSEYSTLYTKFATFTVDILTIHSMGSAIDLALDIAGVVMATAVASVMSIFVAGAGSVLLSQVAADSGALVAVELAAIIAAEVIPIAVLSDLTVSLVAYAVESWTSIEEVLEETFE